MDQHTGSLVAAYCIFILQQLTVTASVPMLMGKEPAMTPSECY